MTIVPALVPKLLPAFTRLAAVKGEDADRAHPYLWELAGTLAAHGGPDAKEAIREALT